MMVVGMEMAELCRTVRRGRDGDGDGGAVGVVMGRTVRCRAVWMGMSVRCGAAGGPRAEVRSASGARERG